MRSVSGESMQIYLVPKLSSDMVKSLCKQCDEEKMQGIIVFVLSPFSFRCQGCCYANISNIVVYDVDKQNMSAEWKS